MLLKISYTNSHDLTPRGQKLVHWCRCYTAAILLATSLSFIYNGWQVWLVAFNLRYLKILYDYSYAFS